MRQKKIRHKRLGTKKISGIGLMIALAFVLSYIESMIPINIGIPGNKSRIFKYSRYFCHVCVWSVYGFWHSNRQDNYLPDLHSEVLQVLCIALAGGMLSFFVMFILKKADIFFRERSECGRWCES